MQRRMVRALCFSMALTCALLCSIACHPGAVIDTDPKPSVGGTIAGVVRSGANPVIGRKVTAVNVSTGASFSATTGANGGYTIKVPEGTYRIDLETQAGESVTKKPDQTQVNNSDLDSARDFEISGAR
jgi:hypothetical protein